MVVGSNLHDLYILGVSGGVVHCLVVESLTFWGSMVVECMAVGSNI
jgi:hypothetical protein